MRLKLLVKTLLATAPIVVATPPACLLAAVNTQPTPSDLNAVCSGSNATDVKQYIDSHCGNNVNAAMNAFSSVCNDAASASQTAAASGTGTAGASSTSSSGVAASDAADVKGAAIVGILGALLAL